MVQIALVVGVSFCPGTELWDIVAPGAKRERTGSVGTPRGGGRPVSPAPESINRWRASLKPATAAAARRGYDAVVWAAGRSIALPEGLERRVVRPRGNHILVSAEFVVAGDDVVSGGGQRK